MGNNMIQKSELKIEKNEFSEILSKIQSSRESVYQQANTILIELYWNIGEYISEKVKNANWGKGVVEELSEFIREREPNVDGFTTRNIWRMKQFFETYIDTVEFSYNSTNEEVIKLSAVGAVLEDTKVQLFGKYLSWTHHRRIMTLKTP